MKDYFIEKVTNQYRVFLFLGLLFTATNILAQKDTTAIQDQQWQTFNTYKDVGYNQPLRPQFHFTSRKNWINDPNGLVYYDGEYHMYFQHNPYLNIWDPKDKVWGHAVSTDLLHWTQLPHAIMPTTRVDGCKWCGIYSGTAVVDEKNVLGKQVGKTKTLVAFFTKGGQSAAFSTDKGKTYEFLNNEKPILSNQGFKDERDPKVFWNEASKKWVMLLFVKKGLKEGSPEEKLGKARFFNSDNLLDWKPTSDFDREWIYECMDIIELPVDNDKKNKKWLIYDASFDYEIGSFDGKTFVSETPTLLGDYGKKVYAGQTFNNVSNGRGIMIAWLNGGDLFTKAEMPFNHQMSFPTELNLKTTTDGIRLFRLPIKEIEKLYQKTYKFNNLTTNIVNEQIANIKVELLDLSIEFEAKSVVDFSFRGIVLKYNSSSEQVIFGNNIIPAKAFNGLVKLRVLVDRSSIEIFVNDGLNAGTFNEVPKPENLSIAISSATDVKITSLIINDLKSIWK